MGRVFLVVQNSGYRRNLAMMIQHQGQGRRQIVGGASWDAGTPETVRAADPDVVVVVVGLEVGAELRRLAQLRAVAPACKLLIIDTLGEVCRWQACGWATADVLLVAERLISDLVPALCRLVGQKPAPAMA